MLEACWHFCSLQGVNEGAGFGRRKKSSTLEETKRSSFLKWSFLQLRNLFRCSTARPIDCHRYPYQETTVNEWFVQSFSDGEEQKNVNIINVSKDGRARKCYTIQNGTSEFLTSLSADNFEVFFHGTNSIGAESVIEEGIIVGRRGETKGKTKLDFSNGDGFYVGECFDDALEWAGRRYKDLSAVLVFRVDKSELRGTSTSTYEGLDLRGDTKKGEWLDVVKQFRSGRPDRKFLKEFKRYDYCEGPMASISGKNPRPTLLDGTYQLCVLTRKCAELFDRSLHSVLFFER